MTAADTKQLLTWVLARNDGVSGAFCLSSLHSLLFVGKCTLTAVPPAATAATDYRDVWQRKL